MWHDLRSMDMIGLRSEAMERLARRRRPHLDIDTSLRGWLLRVVVPRLLVTLVLAFFVIPTIVFIALHVVSSDFARWEEYRRAMEHSFL